MADPPFLRNLQTGGRTEVQGREDYESCDHKVAGPRSHNCGRRKTPACEVQSEIVVRLTFILLSSDRRPALHIFTKVTTWNLASWLESNVAYVWDRFSVQISIRKTSILTEDLRVRLQPVLTLNLNHGCRKEECDLTFGLLCLYNLWGCRQSQQYFVLVFMHT
jgi:hypothetical protein